MQGNPTVIATIQRQLATEWEAQQSYRMQAAYAGNLGYSKLQAYLLDTANDESGHAERLMARLAFLEGAGTCDASKPMPMAGSPAADDLLRMLSADLQTEYDASTAYQTAATEAMGLGDLVTFQLFLSIATEEQEHIDELEGHLARAEQMGVENWLMTMV